MSAASRDTPFAGLDPDAVLDAVESLGLHGDGRVLALNSYENRVYRIGLEDAAPVVAKFYRPGRWSDEAIGEEHAFATELRNAGLSVVAPLAFAGRTLHHHRGHRFALFPLQGGHAPEPGDRDTLRQLGRALGRLHAIGAAGRFVHRATLDIAAFGEAPVEFLLDHDWLPPELEDNFAGLCDAVLDRVERAFELAGDIATLRLHGDCHPGNILWREGQAHFVDLDDCLTGPAVQDLWMLLSGPPHEQRAQLGWLLEGYTLFRDFDPRELHLVEALRALRMLHFNGWIARRWHDPAFPAAFPWFGERRHWEHVIAQLQEQLDALQEPTLSLPP
ncbi:serine/threonine protein kinase [Rehaibacterium terrae]|uniref:Stress response kinase A n=1 Tax=Rehaibacterium terrae TaxID=1341696 RepID=A0A7W7XZJ7_9GAMM|nr:serine/threonine protein kinase [Rehaibacterium terrae]MBB5015336.1 Ser/Thr protein kinase RdoA (MazF antagonist) [Rehaibacterium terrae]